MQFIITPHGEMCYIKQYNIKYVSGITLDLKTHEEWDWAVPIEDFCNYLKTAKVKVW